MQDRCFDAVGVGAGDAEFHSQFICTLETDAFDFFDQLERVFRQNINGFFTVSLVDPHPDLRAKSPVVELDHDALKSEIHLQRRTDRVFFIV